MLLPAFNLGKSAGVAVPFCVADSSCVAAIITVADATIVAGTAVWLKASLVTAMLMRGSCNSRSEESYPSFDTVRVRLAKRLANRLLPLLRSHELSRSPSFLDRGRARDPLPALSSSPPGNAREVHSRSRRPRAQSQEPVGGSPPRPLGGHHRRVGLGKEFAGV